VIDVGSVINGKYRLVRPLGDGGMGSVYEAQHAILGTRVAVKILHPELGRRTGLVERFLQEARVAAQIRSPHVVQVTDVDRTPEGHAYIVMELLEGESLSTVLDRQRKLAVPIACEYTGQILRALEAAHALGVIHRDLKPENVFVTFAAGRPVLKLIDFGIAKVGRSELHSRNLTVAGVVMGTAEYMAPEQARSADTADARSDLYAAGVLLYEMIAGARPVGGDDARAIAMKVERGEVVPLVQVAPDTPREIAGLVHRAMAARPELRFASALDMRMALEGARDSRGLDMRMALEGARDPRGSTAPRLPPASTFAFPKEGGDRAGPRVRGGTTEQLVGSPPRLQSTGGARPAPGGTVAQDPRVDTIRASPRATALSPSSRAGPLTPHGAPSVTAGSPAEPVRRFRSRAVVVALVALSIVLGAAVVALGIGAGTWASSGAGSPASLASVDPARPHPAPSATTLEPAQPVVRNDVPVLAPTRAMAERPRAAPVPARDPGSRDGAGRVLSGRPPSSTPSVDAGPPPFALPSMLPDGLPPFPGPWPSGLALPAGFPSSLPAGLPSALPAGFPSALPSGFPTALPPWPTPTPAPAPADSSSSASSSDPAY
jgi:serine/threonine-protein kinase